MNQESHGMGAAKATMLYMEPKNEAPTVPHREAEQAERDHIPMELCEF